MTYPELHHLLLPLTLLLLFPLTTTTTAAQDSSTSLQLNDDVLGLLVLKSDLNNPTSLSSWNEDSSTPCSWSYIRCHPSTSRVIELYLDNLSLSGKLGRGLENLRNLKLLSLAHNNLTGPFTFTHFPPNLQSLNLSNNQFSGQIPVSAIPTSIKFLDLSANHFTGSLPDNFFHSTCPSLHSLSLSGNSLSGQIPSTLAQCTSLNTLDLSRNHFSGNPYSGSSIWALTRLRVLDLSGNAFSGPLPSGVLYLHNLRELHLQDNQFSGIIPGDIGLCPHLTVVNLSRNRFTQELPPSLANLNSLTHLDLSTNNLSGQLPYWLATNLTNLVVLDLSTNSFTGTLPAFRLGSLQRLVLSNNNFTGTIPASLPSCTHLSILHLGGNSITGVVPEGLFGMGLQELDLSWNRLTGSVPPGSTSKVFESLLVLDLSGNELVGELPPEMGLFTNLAYLNLSWNSRLHSRIPPEIGYLQKLTELDLRSSDLYGEIPRELCESGQLSVLQLDGNGLTGTIPDEIGNCSSLHLLSLSHNKLTGPIPNSISLLKKLEILRLEVNHLAGQIPTSLGSLQNLVAFNISYNRLVGRLPTSGVFPTLQATSLEGNLGLCSPLLSGPCMMNVPKPLVLDPNAYRNQPGNTNHGGSAPDTGRSTRFNHRRFLSLSAIIAMCAAILIVSGVVIVSFLNAKARRSSSTFVDREKNAVGGFEDSSYYYCSSSTSAGIPSIGTLILFDSKSSHDDWIRNSFTEPEFLLNKENEIESGGIGTVHKVCLQSDGRNAVNFAIKKLVSLSTSDHVVHHPEDFDREVRILGRIRHPNLVSLKGYYWTPHLQLLVSEYVPNGNLQSKLHHRPPSVPPLSWQVRFKIMLGMAKGLAHLHHSCNPPVTHFSLNPRNLLLDEKNNAKLSDFGMHKILSNQRQVLCQSAPGYVAPEMACGSSRVNEKCDVYGFGVMVLELVTGRRPLEYGEDSVIVLSDHVRVLLEEGGSAILDCIDQSMGSSYPEEEVLPVLKLALVCTSQIPSSRPSMAEVVQILQVIKTPIPARRLEAY